MKTTQSLVSMENGTRPTPSDGLAASLVDLQRDPLVGSWRRRKHLLAPPTHQAHKGTDLLTFQNKSREGSRRSKHSMTKQETMTTKV